MPFSKLSPKDKQIALQTARHAIQYGLAYHKAPLLELEKYSDSLKALGCCFVTLTESQVLRGCIGALEPSKPLIQDIADHAFAAAFKDSRFPPINKIEEPVLHISISILTPSEPIKVESESQLCESLRPSFDGLVLTYQNNKATFLPSVWKQLPEPEVFVRQLKKKAGLKTDFWNADMRFERYQTINIE